MPGLHFSRLRLPAQTVDATSAYRSVDLHEELDQGALFVRS